MWFMTKLHKKSMIVSFSNFAQFTLPPSSSSSSYPALFEPPVKASSPRTWENMNLIQRILEFFSYHSIQLAYQLEFGRFVEDPLAVTVEHDDVADDGGHREQGQPRAKVQQGRHDAELSRRPVHVHYEGQAVGLDQGSSVLVEVVGVAKV